MKAEALAAEEKLGVSLLRGAYGCVRSLGLHADQAKFLKGADGLPVFRNGGGEAALHQLSGSLRLVLQSPRVHCHCAEFEYRFECPSAFGNKFNMVGDGAFRYVNNPRRGGIGIEHIGDLVEV